MINRTFCGFIIIKQKRFIAIICQTSVKMEVLQQELNIIQSVLWIFREICGEVILFAIEGGKRK